jgi:hypothetical protein
MAQETRGPGERCERHKAAGDMSGGLAPLPDCGAAYRAPIGPYRAVLKAKIEIKNFPESAQNL